MTEEPPQSVSGERYRLLESIFSWDEEIAFLESEPGYSPEIGLKHRAAKRKLANEWIHELRAEFEGLYDEGVLILLRSDVDRPDLIRSLWRLKLTFEMRIGLLRLRLFWRSPAADDVRRLSTAFEHLIGYVCIIRDDFAFTPSNGGR